MRRLTHSSSRVLTSGWPADRPSFAEVARTT